MAKESLETLTPGQNPTEEPDREPRWPAFIGALAAGGLYAALPEALTLGPRWLFPSLVLAVLIPSMSALRKAAVDVLAAKFNRLLRAYQWQYQQPLPPVINRRKRSLYPIVRELDMLEDSFFRCAQSFGFERVARTLSLQEVLAKDDEPEAAGK